MIGKKIKRTQGDGVGVLPGDVLMLVFKRLPAKTLCSLRCVSKQWLKLISDPFFVNHLHWDQWKNKPVMVGVDRVDGSSSTFDVTLVDPENSCSTERYSLRFKDDDYTIAYCSGLLLFYGINNFIHVCNPSTREVFTIDHCNLYYKIKRRLPNPDSIIFSQGNHTCFGFKPSTWQHKFVDLFAVSENMTVRSSGPSKGKALVVTLPSKFAAGSWKYIPMDCLDFWTKIPDTKPICVAGVMYWLIRRCYEYDLQANELLEILTFDLETEVFQVISCPVPWAIVCDKYSLVELEGVLCMVELGGVFLPIMNIWVLKDPKNAPVWVKEYTIDYSNSVIRGFDHPKLFEPPRRLIPSEAVVDHKSEKKKTVLINSTFGGGSSFYSYNLEEETFEKLGVYGKDFTHKFIHYGISLRPVLSCLEIKGYFWNVLFEDNSW